MFIEDMLQLSVRIPGCGNVTMHSGSASEIKKAAQSSLSASEIKKAAQTRAGRKLTQTRGER